MDNLSKLEYRKLMRNFKGLVELTHKTPLKDLENMLTETYDYAINDYIKIEKKRNPEKSRKEILIEMYKLRERLKGRKSK